LTGNEFATNLDGIEVRKREAADTNLARNLKCSNSRITERASGSIAADGAISAEENPMHDNDAV
jgi:hypothetical protein